MRPRPSRARVLLVALAVLVLPLVAHAQDAQTRAQDLNRVAMDEDYLALNVNAALAKLQTALKLCASNKCSKDLVAKTHGNIGTVYSAGMARHDDAVAAFKEMLRIDPTQTPNSAYLTGDVQKDFEAAKAALGGGQVVERAVTALVEKPWPEQATYHPVPVFVELPEGATASRVIVRYRAPGQNDWTELSLQKHKQGWGGYIPCAAVLKAGQLVYFTTAFDANLDRVASGGSAENPRKVQLKTAITSRQPALPGEVPPTACPRPEQRLSCETDDDCPGSQVCRDLGCVTEEAKPEDPEATKRKQNWISVAFSPDLLLLGQTDDACSPSAQEDGKYSCFFSGGVQFTEQPIESGSSNSVTGGFGTPTMRVLLGYDRVLGQRMALGLRLGYAFLGYPEREDGKKFMPFHAEARVAYHLLKDPFAQKGVRPYVFARGGFAEVAGRVNTKVVWNDGVQQQENTVDVYQRAGTLFGGLGGGIQYAVSPEAAMVVELGGQAMFPEFGLVIVPSLGFAYGL